MSSTHYVLWLPWQRPPITMNSNFPRWVRSDVVASLRKAAKVLGQQAKMKPGKHMTVELHYAPGKRINMDSHNLSTMVKPLVDGLARGKRKDLVGLDIVPDDNDQYVTVKNSRIHYPVPIGPKIGPRCWLVVTVDH